MTDTNEEKGQLPPRPSLTDLLGDILDNAKALFRAEMALAQRSYSLKLQALIASMVAMAVGGTIMLAAFIALLVGIVIGLARYIGPFGAAFAVGGAGLILGLVIILLARSAMRRQWHRSWRPAEVVEDEAEAEDAPLSAADDFEQADGTTAPARQYREAVG